MCSHSQPPQRRPTHPEGSWSLLGALCCPKTHISSPQGCSNRDQGSPIHSALAHLTQTECSLLIPTWPDLTSEAFRLEIRTPSVSSPQFSHPIHHCVWGPASSLFPGPISGQLEQLPTPLFCGPFHGPQGPQDGICGLSFVSLPFKASLTPGLTSKSHCYIISFCIFIALRSSPKLKMPLCSLFKAQLHHPHCPLP